MNSAGWRSDRTARAVVVAHRRDGLLALRGHRRDHKLEVLLGVAERELLGPQRLDPRRPRLAIGEVVDVDHSVAIPLAIWAATGDPQLRLLVVDDLALLQVEQEHLAGLQTALALDVLGRDG